MQNNNGQNNKKPNGQTNGQNIKDIAPFKPVFLSFNKMEKITTAVYIVTDNMEDQMLKSRIRANTIELLSISHFLDTLPEEELNHIKCLIKETLSFLSVGVAMNFISQMNGEVVSAVFCEMLEMINNYQNQFVAIDISKFFEVEKNQEKNKQTGHDSLRSPGQPLGNGSEDYHDQSAKSSEKNGKDKQITKSQGQNNNGQSYQGQKEQSKGQAKPVVMGKVFARVIDRKERRDLIYDLAAKLKEFSINDIIGKLPQLNSKTIQRELTSLVEAGILMKKGEQRWVRYAFSTKDLD